MAYKDISRGVRLAADHAKYMLWLNKDTEARQTAYATVTTPANKVKTSRVSGYIVPFDADGANLVYVKAQLIAATQAGRGSGVAKELQQILDPYTFSSSEVTALATPNVLDNARQFKFAKLTLVQRVITATTKEASRITGRKYFRHENDSVTGRFGKKVAADNYSSVTQAIQESPKFVAFFAATANKDNGNKYRFVPEGV